jgi:hypothetical protein
MEDDEKLEDIKMVLCKILSWGMLKIERLEAQIILKGWEQ